MATWRAKLQANLQNLQSQAEASATRWEIGCKALPSSPALLI